MHAGGAGLQLFRSRPTRTQRVQSLQSGRHWATAHSRHSNKTGPPSGPPVPGDHTSGRQRVGAFTTQYRMIMIGFTTHLSPAHHLRPTGTPTRCHPGSGGYHRSKVVSKPIVTGPTGLSRQWPWVGCGPMHGPDSPLLAEGRGE